MAAALRGKVAIAGIGLAGFGEAPGRNEIEILAEASQIAIADAGLSVRDIDGLCTASTTNFFPTLAAAEYLGIRPTFSDSNSIGGSSFVSHLIPAVLALEASLANAVLVAYGNNQRTGAGRTTQGKLKAQLDPQTFEAPYRPFNPPTSYALAAARHMYQYGTKREQLAEVAVAARKWAQLNPMAFSRDPLTIDGVLSSRMISDPLTVRDCCLVTDGGGAFVLTRADRAKSLPQPPVYVLGMGAAHWHRQIANMPDITVTAATESGAKAYSMAGVKPQDVDVAELYDAFTINTILFLEDLGFCGKGEGGSYVEAGAIAPGGRLPVNTNGGGLSCVHPGMYGIFTLIEAVSQLRNAAGKRQIAGAEIALCHGNGGLLSSQVTAILGTAATV
jgi:acetyl-CoA acetyltransferase